MKQPVMSRGIKWAFALMFIPVFLFLTLVGFKWVLPVFPLNNNGWHSYIIFETYSLQTQIESLWLCAGCMLVGLILLMYEGFKKGPKVLQAEFVNDLASVRKKINEAELPSIIEFLKQIKGTTPRHNTRVPETSP